MNNYTLQNGHDQTVTPEERLLWTEKKNTFFGKPWSFTRYLLFQDRFLVKRGFFTRRQEELRLYRVKDVVLRQTFLQRIFHVGTLTIISTDASTARFQLINIRAPEHVAKLISDSAENERISKGLTALECLDAFH